MATLFFLWLLGSQWTSARKGYLIPNLLNNVISIILSVNKILLLTTATLIFASAFVMIGSGSIQSAHACPNKSSGTAAQNVNPTTPSNLNNQLHIQPTSAPIAAGQTA